MLLLWRRFVGWLGVEGRSWCGRRVDTELRAFAGFRVVSWIVVHQRIFSVLPVVDLTCSQRWIAIDCVVNSCRCDIDAIAAGLEAVLIRSVLDLALVTVIVDISVLALHLTIRSFRFDLKAPVGRLVAITVAAILVVTVDLFQNRNGRCVLLLREARTSQADEHENLANKKSRQLSNHFTSGSNDSPTVSSFFFNNFKNSLQFHWEQITEKYCLSLRFKLHSRFRRSTD